MFMLEHIGMNQIEILNNIIIGIPNPIWLIKSGGVSIAATRNAITIAYFLLFFKSLLFTIPALDNNVKATGI